ncbi:MAG: hypothetical protein ACXVDD_22435, partial [Polyangia bacterium]
MKTFLAAAVSLLAVAVAAPAHAQYNRSAGQSAPATEVDRVQVKDASGKVHYEEHVVPVKHDKWGNAQGNQNDLATDGAFEGQTVAVLQLFTGEGFDFSLPRAALKEKGFSVFRWQNQPPPP